MRSLIFHIGCHKTGSSSIQSTLLAERASLQSQGYTLFYANTDGSPRVNGNALPWVRYRPSASSRIQGMARRGFADALADSGENVIVSAESFSWLFSRRQIDTLAARLHRYFDDIRIVTYVRRQDQQAVSHYQQASHRDAIVSTIFYQGNFRALPPYGDHLRFYLDYNGRLSLWGDAFGDENLLIGIFEPDQLHCANVVLDFFNRVGLNQPRKAARMNTSNGAERTKLGHHVSAREFSPAVWNALLKHTDNSGKLLPSRAEATAFYEKFIDSNRQLNRRFSLSDRDAVFGNDFDYYPQEANDLWDEDSANNAVRHLLSGISELGKLQQADLDIIRQAADALRDSSPDLSAKLGEIVDHQNSGHGIYGAFAWNWRSRIRSLARRLGTTGLRKLR